MSICLSVCLSARISKNTSKFHHVFCTYVQKTVAVARYSCYDNVIRYVLPVCWWRYVFRHWSQWIWIKDDAHVSSSSPDGGTAGEVAVYDCRLVSRMRSDVTNSWIDSTQILRVDCLVDLVMYWKCCPNWFRGFGGVRVRSHWLLTLHTPLPRIVLM